MRPRLSEESLAGDVMAGYTVMNVTQNNRPREDALELANFTV